jgi:predicted ArsR family transcriptional regulator
MNAKPRRKDVHGQPLLDTTKGRILVLLCRAPQTVAELAVRLDLSDNAVRAQLQRLQRDGLARPSGQRRGVRRPHVEYEITSDAAELFPRAYEPMFKELVDVLLERLATARWTDLILRAGRRVVDQRLGEIRRGNPRRRVREILSKLNGTALGIESLKRGRKLVVRSCSCPIASVTADHPELCGLFARLIGEVLGAHVRERCERGDSPRCHFEVNRGRR